MKFIVILIFTFLTNIFCSNAMFENGKFLNVGMKIGYQFGKGGGTVYGLEISYFDFTIPSDGYVLDLDYIDNDNIDNDYMLHLGYERAETAGFEFGPTFYLRNNKIEYGVTANAFIGLFTIPYFGINYFPRLNDYYTQFGAYFKLPIPISISK